MDIFGVIIEACIGFVGFAGVVVALSGEPKHWRHEEKLRLGLMLILFLTPLFMSFLCLLLGLSFPQSVFGYWLSIIASLVIIAACLNFFLLSKKYYGTPGTPLSVSVAVFGHLTLVSMALITLFNAFFRLVPVLSMLIGLLVWCIFLGAIIFLRILFHRPGMDKRT